MNIAALVLQIRASNTRFGNAVTGAAELALAQENTLKDEIAFVIPLSDTAVPNKVDTAISQQITERFAVIVALKNDTERKDKLGVVAYNKIDAVRAEIFHAVLGYQATLDESRAYYRGGRLLDFNSAWLWWQFEFELSSHIDDDDGVDVGADGLPLLRTLYAQYVLAPSSVLPVSGDLPTELAAPELSQYIEFTYDHGPDFSSAFKTAASVDADRRES